MSENTDKIKKLKFLSDEQESLDNQKKEIEKELRDNLKELVGNSIQITSLNKYTLELYFGFGNLDYTDFSQLCEYIKDELGFEPQSIFENTVLKYNGNEKGLNFTFGIRN